MFLKLKTAGCNTKRLKNIIRTESEREIDRRGRWFHLDKTQNM
ncbi:uncharacterized protein [Zea mays]|nr:uncharacterized protein LOC100278352 [Zea mays]XP_035815404.1 uncharacterized protein LOC100278352 isoform X2 [Zea mays]ACG45308.1 hypothetical protein [Zea mays]